MRDFVLLFIFILFSFILEMYFPNKEGSTSKRNLKEDLIYFILNEILISSFTIYFVFIIIKLISPQIALINISKESLFLQFTLYLLYIDFLSYWLHRFVHINKALWKIHILHHSPTELNPLTTFRHSILWQVYIITAVSFFGSLIAADLRVVTLVGATAILFDVVQHANIKINEKKISTIFITPKNHRLHHSKSNHYTHGQNFGLIFTIWDRIFGTHYYVEREEILGLEEPIQKKSIIKSYLYPLIK